MAAFGLRSHSSFFILHFFSSSVSTLSSFSAERRSWNCPLIAIVMPPVSSDTTITTASLVCDIPMAARWRKPNYFGMSRLCDTGRMHPAALMRCREMIIAPSCKGEFLKKMFSISLWLILASILSPVSDTSSRGVVRSITMSAPTFRLLMFMHASTIGTIISLLAP